MNRRTDCLYKVGVFKEALSVLVQDPVCFDCDGVYDGIKARTGLGEGFWV